MKRKGFADLGIVGIFSALESFLTLIPARIFAPDLVLVPDSSDFGLEILVIILRDQIKKAEMEITLDFAYVFQ